jgi:hypothetical protein
MKPATMARPRHVNYARRQSRVMIVGAARVCDSTAVDRVEDQGNGRAREKKRIQEKAWAEIGGNKRVALITCCEAAWISLFWPRSTGPPVPWLHQRESAMATSLLAISRSQVGWASLGRGLSGAGGVPSSQNVSNTGSGEGGTLAPPLSC